LLSLEEPEDHRDDDPERDESGDEGERRNPEPSYLSAQVDPTGAAPDG